MSVPFINDKSLTMLSGTGEGRFTHRIKKCLVPGMMPTYYRKEMESQTIAVIEVLAQEFFRLIAPWQPQTFIAYHPSLRTYFVLSEAVDGYKPLPAGEQDRFNQGVYPGLGQLMIISVFLQEIDLKNRNIGLNRYGHVIKIDGDWCFAAIRDADFSAYKKDITPELLNSLPIPIGYTAFNWLDLYQEAVASFTSTIVNESLSNAPHFREEINEAMLKILVLPDEYIKRFVDAFVPVSAKADVFIKYLMNRREELKCAALQNASFKQFLLDKAPQDVVKEHILHMNGFLANGKYPIVEDNAKQELNDAAMIRYSELTADIFSNGLISLESLSIDYSSLNTTAELFAYRDQLLETIDGFVAGIIKPKNQQLLEKYNLLFNLAEEKIKLVQSRAKQLEPSFLFLDQIDFEKHINIFTQIRSQMKKKALNNSNYEDAQHATEAFCDALTNTKRVFLNLNSPYEQAKDKFIVECIRASTDAKKELKDHREWIGAIRKFLIDIITFLTKGLLGSKLSMFAKTNSVQKLDDFEQQVNYQVK
jgi:hypothetical protein